MTRDDRIAYVYLNLIDKKNRSAIYKIIERIGITSTTTAQRTVAKIDDWNKSERDLFLATYTPTDADLYKLKEILEEKTETAAKNEELHTSVNVVETLQNELSQQAEESRKTIIESCKEKDEKDEEIRLLKIELQKHKIYNRWLSKEELSELNLLGTNTRRVYTETVVKEFAKENEFLKESLKLKDEEIRLLNLELHKYKNDLNTVLEDRNKLECMLHDTTQETEVAAEFREIIEEMIALYISKNKDYGNAFSQSYDEFGAVMAVIRINDKLNRLKTLTRQNSEVKTESVKDTLIDLANYTVMTIIEMKRRG